MNDHNKKEARATEIRLTTASGILEVLWEDGTRSGYTFSMLRQRCLCTECKSATIRSGQKTVAVADDVTVTNILPVGNYAIQLVFDDGHDRGIYPFSYLRELSAVQTTV